MVLLKLYDKNIINQAYYNNDATNYYRILRIKYDMYASKAFKLIKSFTTGREKDNYSQMHWPKYLSYK